jgi:hypothetical protein
VACLRSLGQKDKILILISGISSDLGISRRCPRTTHFQCGFLLPSPASAAPRILFLIHRGDCLHPTRSQGPNVAFLLPKNQTFLSPNLPLGPIGAQTAWPDGGS